MKKSKVRMSGGTRLHKLTTDNWRKGYNSFLDSVRRDRTSIDIARNLMLEQDGVVKRRWGTRNYGSALEGKNLEGVATFSKLVNDKLENWLIVVAEGAVFTSRTGENWERAEGEPLAKDAEVCFLTVKNKVFLANGKDPLAFYDIERNKLEKYNKINPPASPNVRLDGDLKTGEIKGYYKLTAVNNVGETTASNSVEIKFNKARDTWRNEKDKTEAVRLNWDAVEGATRYNIYYGDEKGREMLLTSVSATVFIDEGSLLPNPLSTAPEDNTTDGPIVKTITYADSRIWGVGDPKHLSRVYFGGVGEDVASFSPYYGGGMIEMETGDSNFPVVIKGYRDGKGEDSVVLFMSGSSGEGSQYQLTPVLKQAGTTKYIAVEVGRVIGSLGTFSPRSVIEVKNNLYYASLSSFNTTGAKPDMLNVLSTDEVSLAIRPDVRRIGASGARKIASSYYDGKIFWAVANGEEVNNQVWVLDTELRSWILPWELPVKYFIQHTDENGLEHLLFLPSKDTKLFKRNQLVELSERFNTDNGEPFEVHFATGVIAMDSSHTDWAKVKKIYFEFLHSEGELAVEIGGEMKSKNLAKTKKIKMNVHNILAGFNTDLWDSFNWNDSENVPKVVKRKTVKKVLKVRKKLNNVRIELKSDSLSDWGLSVIAIEEMVKKVSDPSGWKK